MIGTVSRWPFVTGTTTLFSPRLRGLSAQGSPNGHA